MRQILNTSKMMWSLLVHLWFIFLDFGMNWVPMSVWPFSAYDPVTALHKRVFITFSLYFDAQVVKICSSNYWGCQCSVTYQRPQGSNTTLGRFSHQYVWKDMPFGAFQKYLSNPVIAAILVPVQSAVSTGGGRECTCSRVKQLSHYPLPTEHLAIHIFNLRPKWPLISTRCIINKLIK